MAAMVHRIAIVSAAAFASLAFTAVFSPGTSNATECGWGTVFDPPSNTCVAAAVPPPPPPPPPPWNGDPTPYFSVGVCAPIPFVALCTGI